MRVTFNNFGLAALTFVIMVSMFAPQNVDAQDITYIDADGVKIFCCQLIAISTKIHIFK